MPHGRTLLALAATAALGLVPTATAAASCGPRKAVDQLEKAEAAFIGRVVDRRDRIVVFEVDEEVKGELPARVEVFDEHFMTSVGLGFDPNGRGAPTGVFLRRGADGGFVANSCDLAPPGAMRAAAARSGRPCGRPRLRVTRIRRSGRRVRVSLRLHAPEGRPETLHVAWGDGRPTSAKLGSGPRRRTLEVTHRYRRSGHFAVEAHVYILTLECGYGVTAGAPRVHFPVR